MKKKVPFSSAINVLFDGVLISVSTKCGKWVVYTERVTFYTVYQLSEQHVMSAALPVRELGYLYTHGVSYI